MKQLLAVTIVLLFASSLCGQQPQDQSKRYLTIITNSDWERRPEDRNLVEMVTTNKNLLALAKKCHFEHVTPDQDIYKTLWYKFYPKESLPVVIMQEPGGDILYKASGQNISPYGDTLYEDMKATYEEVMKLRQGLPKQQYGEPDAEIEPEYVSDTAEFFGGGSPVRDALGMSIMLGSLMLFLIIAVIVMNILERNRK